MIFPNGWTLSGNGLVGRIKKALGLNPTNTFNPLTLKQVGIDATNGVVTFEMPVSYAMLTNIGSVNLNLNGIDVTLEDFYLATNGNSRLRWNTLYDPPGLHYIQAQINLAGNGDASAINTGMGLLTPFNSDNAVQFFESDAIFSSSFAYLDAQLPVQNANYTIRLYDNSTTPPALMKTITNSTANGMIQEDWDLTQDNNNAFTGGSFTASFDVALLDSAGGTPVAERTQTKLMAQMPGAAGHSPYQSDGFDFVYFYTPTNSSMASSFSEGKVWSGMQSTVDTLISQTLWFDVYHTSFNRPGWPLVFNGYPGYITSQNTITNTSIYGNLYSSLTDGITKNFYAYGHGSATSIGNGDGNVRLRANEVADLLGNQVNLDTGVYCPTNPYRFVFLDGCSTASQNNWRHAFGIFQLGETNTAARPILGGQAYVGWSAPVVDFLNYNSTNGQVFKEDVAEGYTKTLQKFYFDWMNGKSVSECIQNASDKYLVYVPLPVPENQIGFMDNTFFRYYFTAKIYVIGHSGLTINGARSQFENQYAAPKNIQ